jgi:hypothetical protein
MLVFIDESGDPGFKLTKGSTKTFVAALVAFRDPASATAACSVIDELSGRLKLKGEFKFHKSRPEIRDAFFAALKPCEFIVRAIVVEKEKIYSQHLRSHKEPFYAFFVKSMLKFDSGLLNGAKVVIDGSGDREYKQQLAKYLRQHCAQGAIKEVKFANSSNDRLVQLADMCAGAIARSYKSEKVDACRWRDMLKPKIDDVCSFM